MLVSSSVIPQIASDYLLGNLVPKIGNSWGQFAIGFALPFAKDVLNARIAQYSPMLKFLGIMDENDKIDLDKAKDAATKALQNVGGKLYIMNGYYLNQEDINVIYEIAKQHGVEQ